MFTKKKMPYHYNPARWKNRFPLYRSPEWYEQFIALMTALYDKCGNPAHAYYCCGLDCVISEKPYNYLLLEEWIQTHPEQVQRILSYNVESLQ